MFRVDTCAGLEYYIVLHKRCVCMDTCRVTGVQMTCTMMACTVLAKWLLKDLRHCGHCQQHIIGLLAVERLKVLISYCSQLIATYHI